MDNDRVRTLKEALLKVVDEFYAGLDLNNHALTAEEQSDLEAYVNALSADKYTEYLEFHEETIAGMRSTGRRGVEDLVHKVVQTADSEARLNAQVKFILTVRARP